MVEGLIDKVVRYADPKSLLRERDKIADSCSGHEPIEGKSNIESILVKIKCGLPIPDGVNTQCMHCGTIYERPYNLKERGMIAITIENIQKESSSGYRI